MNNFEHLPEMSMSLVLNEIRLHVDLTDRQDKDDCLAVLQDMGFNPKLMRYTWYSPNVINEPKQEICAFLYSEVVKDKDPLDRLDELNPQFDALADVFGSQNVCLVLGTAD